eukprot:7860267-Heterocapsa_arctica.AAC.1
MSRGVRSNVSAPSRDEVASLADPSERKEQGRVLVLPPVTLLSLREERPTLRGHKRVGAGWAGLARSLALVLPGSSE